MVGGVDRGPARDVVGKLEKGITCHLKLLARLPTSMYVSKTVKGSLDGLENLSRAGNGQFWCNGASISQ